MDEHELRQKLADIEEARRWNRWADNACHVVVLIAVFALVGVLLWALSTGGWQ
jgi:hypothetical protein